MTGERLHLLVDDWRPRALVAITLLPAFRATQVAGDLPVWMDLFGDPLAEAQAKAALTGNDDVVYPYYDLLMPVLQRGDRFSAISRAQASALEGQLSLAGRMSRKTAYYRMTQTIPCSLDPSIVPNKDVARVNIVPDDAFVLLWTGGFNTWCDVDTLFLGVEKAMSRNPKLHFIATGAELGEQDSSTFSHFSTLVERSSFQERYHLQGWVDYSDLSSYYATADVAINSDRNLLEVRLGTKTRFMEWISWKIPIITSRLSELSRELERYKAAYAFSPGDAETLAKILVYSASHKDELTKMATKALSYASSRFSVDQTTRSVVQWCRRPRRAPDSRGRLDLAQAAEAKLRKEIKLTGDHIKNLDTMINNLKSAEQASREQIQQARNETVETRALVELERKKASTWEQEISKLMLDRDHWKQNSASLEERIRVREQDFSELKEGLEQQLARQKELTDEVGKQLRYWEGVVRKRDSKISDLENKYVETKKELLEFQTLSSSQAKDLGELRRELEAKNRQVAELVEWSEKVRSALPYRIFNVFRGRRKNS